MTVAPDLAERVLKAAQLAAPIYAAHEWMWGEGAASHVPQVEELADRIKDLYDRAALNATGSCSTGRLSVWVDTEDGAIAVEVQLADLRDPVPGWEPPDGC